MTNFQIKYSDIFHISAKNIDCGYSLEPPRRGGLTSTHNLCFQQKYEKYQNILSENLSFERFNEYPQSMFLSRNYINNVYPCKPQFYYIKVGFKGVLIIQVCFPDGDEEQTVKRHKDTVSITDIQLKKSYNREAVFEPLTKILEVGAGVYTCVTWLHD